MKPLWKSRTAWTALVLAVAKPVMDFLAIPPGIQESALVALAALAAIFLRAALNKVNPT